LQSTGKLEEGKRCPETPTWHGVEYVEDDMPLDVPGGGEVEFIVG
jgi:hypothetical protein